ncbi:hypothetical protein AGMMS49938_11690 [Fibrobacterales bacterium]|nr:hypothetical protein AGMMS49938_11690 [Fibrobacterales bacterium]
MKNTIAIYLFIVAFSFANEWEHYTAQNEVRDIVRAEDASLWLAMPYGLLNVKNGAEKKYMPSINGLNAADFVQVFALANGDIAGATKKGVIVRKEKKSQNFEIINESYTEKERTLLNGLGKNAKNILVLPFNNALSFFDYVQKRSVLTVDKIGTSSLEHIKRIAIKNDSIWVELADAIWKREIDWEKIYDDRFLADPNSWSKADTIFFDDPPKPAYTPHGSNFFLNEVKTLAVMQGEGVIAWGSDYNYFSKMQNGTWGRAFWANPKEYNGDQKNYQTKSLAAQSNGNFAFGNWGAGFTAFNSNFPVAEEVFWLHSQNTNNQCPTNFSAEEGDWTIVQGVTAIDNGYLFSYVSADNYGIGIIDNKGNYKCYKYKENSSPAAIGILEKDGEIFVAWKTSLEAKDGGIDIYNNKFELIKKTPSHFGFPLDFAFDKNGILWLVSTNKIFYLDNFEFKEPVNNLSNVVFSSIEVDANNGLWLGTLGGGAYSLTQKNGKPDSLTYKRISIRSGLLNELVYDIAIDTLKGLVYFAHDLGVSVYSTAEVRSANGFMESGAPKVFAYPNPFRPEIHRRLIIDNVSENGIVYIFNSSGRRVRIFEKADLKGGRVIWNGTAENGRTVSPGLYHYFAVDGKNTAKGKILLER